MSQHILGPKIMEGATSSANGAAGLVPAPQAGNENKFLRADGTWNNVEALPAVTASDNDKVLKVVSGAWAAATAPSGLPAVTSSDNGKFLQVVNGAWAAATVPNANGVSF